MNKQRRKAIENIIAQIDDLHSKIEDPGMSKKKLTKFRRVSPHGFCFRHDCPFVFCGLLNQSAVKKAVEYCVDQTPDVEPELLREFLLSKVSELLKEMVRR